MNDPIVLCYHGIHPQLATELDVRPDRMEQHVRMLLRLGYRPATFADALLRPRTDRCFAVTFDDALRSVRQHALPVLDRLGVPATLAVPSGWVGRRAAWNELPELAGDATALDVMSWDEVRSFVDAGWEIASHSVTHPRLSTVTDEQLAEELVGGKAAIESQLGVRCETILYPYGDVDDRVVRAALAAGYRAGGSLPPAAEIARRGLTTPMRFPRVGVYPVDDPARFAAKLAAAFVGTRGAGRSVPDPVQERAIPAPAPERAAAPASGEPRVAVIIPCFNDGPLAKEAVASVVEDEPVEIVVVDDCSTDPETAVALDELRGAGVRVVRHEVNQGLSAARRTGLAATTAPYVFPLDSDDLMVEGALARLADRLDADPGAAAAWGDVVEFGTRERHGRVPAHLEGFRVAYRNDYPVCSLFRRSALERVGAWQDVGGMVGYEDWNLWMTLAERNETGYHAGPGVVAVRRRLHGFRMLGDSITRHRRLYEELRRTHPRLFAEQRDHRRRSELALVPRVGYPLVFGGRPPLGIRNRFWEAKDRAGRLLSRRRS